MPTKLLMAEGADVKVEKEEGEITPKKGEDEASKKHPLEHHWTLWFDNPQTRKGQAWGSTMRPVYTFGTVEDFWCLFNNVVQPSALIVGADLHLFKKGIEPKWEDPKCEHGGKWTLPVRKGGKGPDSKGPTQLDTFWLHTLLAMIGEQFDDGEEVCGVVLQIRSKEDRIAIWTKTANNETAQVNLAKQWKEFLDTDDRIGYITHSDAKELDRAAKNKYTL